MAGDLIRLAIPAWQIVVRVTVIYLVLLLGFRLFGKREIGQFTLFDLVLVLLIANAVQPAMTGPDTSLLGGLLIIGTLLVVNFAVNWLEIRLPLFREAFVGEPTIIAQDGKWRTQAMRREGVSQREAEMALREHGVERVEDTRLVVLETDGSFSVVPREAWVTQARRRRRYIRRP
jgi:uncharacterized membrane protein YcaP (DUF421 family)